MVTEAQLILAISDFYDALTQVIHVNRAAPSSESSLDCPPEVAARYDDLAAALVTYVRLEPDAEDAIRKASELCRFLDAAVQLRCRQAVPQNGANRLPDSSLR